MGVQQKISVVCLALLFLFQICIPTHAEKTKDEVQAEPCTAPNGSPGHCLLYTECANLTQWRSQHNLQEIEDVKQMLCKEDQVHVCCNHTNPYFTDTDYLSHMNPYGLALLQGMRCTRPFSDRVSNGEAALLREYPFMALLRYDVPKRKFLCGGSLITTWFVLTAGHCITPTLDGVRLGEHNLSTEIDCVDEIICLPPYEDFQIAQKIKHPRYNKPWLTHDIALLKLDREVQFKVHIKPICLPVTPLVYEHNSLPETYYVAGWGHTETSNNTEVLQRARIPHQSRDVCRSIFAPRGVRITQDHICAGGEERIDTCKGDSGGPLFASVPFNKIKNIKLSRVVQFGIVSFGLIGCGGNNTNAAAYANVFEYMPWITDTLAIYT